MMRGKQKTDKQKSVNTKKEGTKVASCPDPIIEIEGVTVAESPCIKEDIAKKEERNIA